MAKHRLLLSLFFAIVCNLTLSAQYDIAASIGTTGFSLDVPAAVVIDPDIEVTHPTNANINGARVEITTGFISTEDELIYPADLHGVTGVYNSETGILMLSGTASPAQFQAIFRSIEYNNTQGALANMTVRTVKFALGDAILENPCGFAEPHYYKFIDEFANDWIGARDAAASQTYFGYTGYLATITCPEENALILSKIDASAWIGASDHNSQWPAAFDRRWYWVTGPERGQQFYDDHTPLMYENWNDQGGENEPNNMGGQEHYAVIYGNTDIPSYGTPGFWNDVKQVPEAGDKIKGYIVEFGGTPGDPTINISDTKEIEFVTWDGDPGPISGDSPVCAGTSETYSIAAVTGSTTYEWAYTGTNTTFTATTIVPEVTLAFASNATGGTLTVTPYNGATAGTVTTAAEDITITVNTIPTLSGSITGDNEICAPQTGVAYSISAQAGVTGYVWAFSGAGETINGATNSITIDYATNATDGDVSVYCTSSCGDTDPLTFSVEVDAQPSAEAGSDIAKCEVTNLTLDAVIPSVGSGLWTSSDAGVAFSSAAANNATATNIQLGSTTFTWTVINGECSASDQVTLQNDTRIISAAGIDQTFCDITTATLDANSPAPGTGLWSTTNTDITLANSSLATSDISTMPEGSVTLTWTITNGVCTSSDNVKITRDVTVTSVAGDDIFGCETSTVALTANTPAAGNGTWTSNDAGVGFANAGAPNSNAVNLQLGSTVFTWTIVNGSCTHSDNLTVQIDELITATAGADDRFCDVTTSTITADVPSSGAGVWTTDQVSVNFDDASAATANVSNLPEGSIIFTWTVTNGSCTDSDQLTIIRDVTETAVAAEDVTACEVATFKLVGNKPVKGQGVWSTADMSKIITNPSSENATASNFEYGTTVFTWTITNGTCSHSDDLTVQNDSLIEAVAAADKRFCDLSTTQIEANAVAPGIGVWTNTQGVSIANINSELTNVSGLLAGINTFTWTVTNGTCTDFDQTVITRDVTIPADAGTDAALCQTPTASLHATVAANAHWEAFQTQALITSANSATSGVSNLEFGENKFVWIAISGTCTDSDTVTITRNAAPDIYAGMNIGVCKGDSATLFAISDFPITWNNNIIQNVPFLPSATRDYTATATSPEGCTKTDIVTVTVNPLPRVEADISVNAQITIDGFSDAQPLSYAINDDNYVSTPVFSGLEEGEYILKVKDDNNCIDSILIYLNVEVPLIIPTIFTPNGDGVNDTWDIDGIDKLDGEIKIYIFDRFGKELIRYSAADNGWNGQYMGQPVKPDTYWYVIESDYKSFKGHITIKR